MLQTEHPNKGSIAKTLIVYLGGAWVFIEAINFLIDKYNWNTTILDVLILLVIFGLPAILIYTWFHQEFTRKAIVLQAINGILALTVIGFTLINPGSLNPTQLRLLKFKDNQKKLAESIQSIVILPFDNFTGNDENEYFVSGMHSSLITDMGRIGALRVICTTTSNTFKATDMSVSKIASELGVDAAVEGSISCFGEDSVCIQIRLISALGEEQQLWVQDFRIAKSQILNFYNDVTKKISQEINIVLSPREENFLAESRTVNTEAYDAYLKGRYYWDDLSVESLYKAREYLENAVEMAPDWAAPYAGLAQVWVGLAQMGIESPEIAGPRIMENIGKAIELDPDFPDSHYISGIIAVWTEWNWEKGEKEFLHALAINPSDAMSRIFYAHLLMSLQRQDEAMSQAQRAVELDPLNPLLLGLYSVVAINGRHWEDARAHIDRSLSLDPDGFFTNTILEYLGFHDKDIETIMQTLKICWHVEDTVLQKLKRISEEEGFDAAFTEVLHQFELIYQAGYGSPLDIAIRSMMSNQPEKALESLEIAFHVRDPNMPYITTQIFNFEPLYDNPRFIDIVEKMNLPLPDSE